MFLEEGSYMPRRLKKTRLSKFEFKRRIADREAGYFMVEALVCVLIVGILSAGLFDGYAKIRSMSVATQTQLQAVSLVQECFDQLRAQAYGNLVNGNYAVPLVSNGPTGIALFPRPLLRDTSGAYNFYKNGIAGFNADDSANYIQCVGGVVNVQIAASANGGAAAKDVTV